VSAPAPDEEPLRIGAVEFAEPEPTEPATEEPAEDLPAAWAV
jgi:hypothetical protein